MIPHISFTEMIGAVILAYAVGYLQGAWRSYRFFKKD